MPSELPQLDNRSVSLVMSINGTQKILRGQAKLKQDTDLGRVLAVEVPDAAGALEFLIQEANWSGRIIRDLTGDSDYRIALTADCACVG